MLGAHCDGLLSEGDPSLPASEATTWSPDEDEDTYGASSGADHCWPPEDYVANADDCDGSAEDETQDCVISGDSTVVLNGSSSDDTLSGTLASLGDVTGDGLVDAGGAAIGTTSGKGTLYLLQGTSELTDVAFTDIAANGLIGSSSDDAFGLGVAGLGATLAGGGDLDDNGYPELLFGAPTADDGSTMDVGAAWLIRGGY